MSLPRGSRSRQTPTAVPTRSRSGSRLLRRQRCGVRITRNGKWVATPSGSLEAGARKIDWDGVKRVGRLVDGTYEATVEATDSIATSTVALPFSADTPAAAASDRPAQPAQNLDQRDQVELTLRFGTRRLVYDATVAGIVRFRTRPVWDWCAVAWIRPATRAFPHPSGRAARVRRASTGATARSRSRPIGQNLRQDEPLVYERLSASDSGEESERRDWRALAALCERHAPRVERLAHHLLRDHEDACDASQDAPSRSSA